MTLKSLYSKDLCLSCLVALLVLHLSPAAARGQERMNFRPLLAELTLEVNVAGVLLSEEEIVVVTGFDPTDEKPYRARLHPTLSYRYVEQFFFLEREDFRELIELDVSLSMTGKPELATKRFLRPQGARRPPARPLYYDPTEITSDGYRALFGHRNHNREIGTLNDIPMGYEFVELPWDGANNRLLPLLDACAVWFGKEEVGWTPWLLRREQKRADLGPRLSRSLFYASYVIFVVALWVLIAALAMAFSGEDDDPPITKFAAVASSLLVLVAVGGLFLGRQSSTKMLSSWEELSTAIPAANHYLEGVGEFEGHLLGGIRLRLPDYALGREFVKAHSLTKAWFNITIFVPLLLIALIVLLLRLGALDRVSRKILKNREDFYLKGDEEDPMPKKKNGWTEGSTSPIERLAAETKPVRRKPSDPPSNLFLNDEEKQRAAFRRRGALRRKSKEADATAATGESYTAAVKAETEYMQAAIERERAHHKGMSLMEKLKKLDELDVDVEIARKEREISGLQDQEAQSRSGVRRQTLDEHVASRMSAARKKVQAGGQAYKEQKEEIVGINEMDIPQEDKDYLIDRIKVETQRLVDELG